MKTQIFKTLVLILAVALSGQLFAQPAADAISKQKTKSNNTNERSGAGSAGACVGKVRCADGACVISFEQDIVSPRDAASGLPTGKRMHKPFVITKVFDKSSPVLAKGSSGGMGSGKVSMSDLSVMITIQGRSRKLPVNNNEFSLPTDCPNGDCDLIATWSWGASNSGVTQRCEVPITVSMADGVCMAINEKGHGGSK